MLARDDLVPLAVFTTDAITFYSFVYERPELILEAELAFSGEMASDEEGDSEAGLMLLLANVESSSADEVHFTTTADAFKFDNDIPSTDSITRSYEPPQAVMEIRRGRRSGFIGGGRRHDTHLENVVCDGGVPELRRGTAIFREGNHDLKYQIAFNKRGRGGGNLF